jgi:ABC-2 type transport system permease protein
VSSPFVVVARTEYLEGVRSRWFRVVTALVPFLFVGGIVLAAGLSAHASDELVRLAIADHSDPPIGDIVRKSLELPHGGKARFAVLALTRDENAGAGLEARVSSGELDGYLTLPRDVARGGRSVYRGANASSISLVPRLMTALRSGVIAGRAKSLGLQEEDVGTLLAEVSLDAEQTGAGRKGTGGGASKGASGDVTLAAGYAESFILYLAILLYGVTVARSVVQEKTSRIIEVLMSCARPWDLMLGKIVGVGALGLTQLAIWLSAALALVSFRGPLLARLGMPGAEALQTPTLGWTEIAVLLVYFLGGYFLYAALFAGAGAACSTERDVQQTQLPVVLPMVVAFMSFPVITANPRSPTAVVMTLIPFFSPILMPIRCLLTPVPPWQLAVSVGLLAATVAGTTWLGSRVYRVGILMYGQKPGIAEIARWIRAG